MNLTAAIADLRGKIGNPTVANIADLELAGNLNTAYSFIAGRYPFSELRKVVSFSTVVGTDRYTVPADLNFMKRLWDDTSKKKIFKRGARFVASVPLNWATGRPRFYFRTDDWIQILPSCDKIYSLMLYYQSQPAVLVAGTDTPVIPTAWHDGWVLKARHIYYDGKGDIGKAIYAKNEWKEWVSDKPSEVDMEKEDLDDVALELPELGEWASQSRTPDPRFDTSFDTSE